MQSPIPPSDQTADSMAIAQGASLTDVIQTVFQEPVYREGVVNDLILMLFDRNPYGSDAANLTLGLEMGMTDDQVLAMLATSTPYQEYFNKTVN
jgi:hypothetical protein